MKLEQLYLPEMLEGLDEFELWWLRLLTSGIDEESGAYKEWPQIIGAVELRDLYHKHCNKPLTPTQFGMKLSKVTCGRATSTHAKKGKNGSVYNLMPHKVACLAWRYSMGFRVEQDLDCFEGPPSNKLCLLCDLFSCELPQMVCYCCKKSFERTSLGYLRSIRGDGVIRW
jgi:hypothetical protein